MKMQIKYHKVAEYGDFGKEELEAISFWHKICAALAAVLFLSLLVGMRTRNIELGESSPAGFAHWFLLCCAYPVLEIAGLVNMLAGVQDNWFMQFVTGDNQVMGVFCIDIVTLAVIWALGRWLGIRAIGAEKLRVVANFLAIILGWGVFQLMLFGIVTVWHGGGFTPLHNNLREEDPEKVIVVKSSPISK